MDKQTVEFVEMEYYLVLRWSELSSHEKMWWRELKCMLLIEK